MTETQAAKAVRGRAIGRLGTTARVLVGLLMAGSVAWGHLVSGPFDPVPWLVGLVGMPAVMLAGQWARARLRPGRLVFGTSRAGHAANLLIFLVLYLTWWYAPPIGFLSDAALLFYGVSMLLAAIRGYAGCEVLAVSNWLLRRDDQLGCVLFDDLDRYERRRST